MLHRQRTHLISIPQEGVTSSNKIDWAAYIYLTCELLSLVGAGVAAMGATAPAAAAAVAEGGAVAAEFVAAGAVGEGPAGFDFGA